MHDIGSQFVTWKVGCGVSVETNSKGGIKLRLRFMNVFLAAVFIALFEMSLVAADTVVVKPDNAALTGWTITSRLGDPVQADAAVEFVSGYERPPAGSGSLFLRVGSGTSDPLPKVYIGTKDYTGLRLDRITQFKLWICPRSWDCRGAQPVTLEIAISKQDKLRLCTFHPWGIDPPGFYGTGVWREVDMLSPDGSWEITNMDGANREGNWRWLVRRYPDAAIAAPPVSDWPYGTLTGAGINIKIGTGKASRPSHSGKAGWRESSGCSANVDKLTIGYRDANGQEVVTTYDFEAE